jgi:protein O-GlcNAc transferase
VTHAKLALAIEEHRRGNLKAAEHWYHEVLQQDPNESDAIHLLGVIAIQTDHLASAIVLIEQAIAIHPKAEYFGNLGVGLEKMNRLHEAQKAYEKALELKPSYVEALLNLGVVYSRQRDFQKAIMNYERATQLAPLSFEAWHNLGIACSEFGNLPSALSAYEQASRLRPHDANVFANAGIAYVSQGDLMAAKFAFEEAIRLDSNHVQANKQLAVICRGQELYDDAIRHARQALAFSKDDLECKLLLVDLLQRTHAWDELTGSLKPEAIADQMQGMATIAFENSRGASNSLGSDLAALQLPLVSPLSILALPCEVDSCTNRAFAQRWAASQSLNAIAERRALPRVIDSGPLRIGYLSADFRSHPVGYCLPEMIESHDHERFEVFGYSIGYDDGSEIRQRLIKAFDRWIDLSHLTLHAAAEQIRSDKIDILVDLQGYTEGARTQIISFRPAPIQVNYLGFPGTMGAEFIDYVLTDEFVLPKTNSSAFQEMPIYLPGCYLPRDSQRTILAIPRTRAEERLPKDAFVFCAFSSPHKITAEVFDSWLYILTQVPQSILWLRSSNVTIDDRLRARAQRNGIDTQRLVFAAVVSMQQHLGRQRLADLFLDTFPYNQHSTAQDALALGLPLLTMTGMNVPSRVAGSLLASLDLPELISISLGEYQSKAIDFALNSEYRKAIYERLAEALAQGKLADGKTTARKLESAFLAMAGVNRS